jgi:hypothetical protein
VTSRCSTALSDPSRSACAGADTVIACLSLWGQVYVCVCVCACVWLCVCVRMFMDVDASARVP